MGTFAERAHDLRQRFADASPGVDQQIDDRSHRRVGRIVRELDLDLAEPVNDATALEHRHLVVDDLGHQAIVDRSHDPRSVADGLQAEYRPDRSTPDEAPDEVDRFRRRLPAPPSKECSCRTTVGPATDNGSFTVHPSAVRYRRDAPQRTRRRSSVSW